MSSFWAKFEFAEFVFFLFGRFALIIVESSITLTFERKRLTWWSSIDIFVKKSWYMFINSSKSLYNREIIILHQVVSDMKVSNYIDTLVVTNNLNLHVF